MKKIILSFFVLCTCFLDVDLGPSDTSGLALMVGVNLAEARPRFHPRAGVARRVDRRVDRRVARRVDRRVDRRVERREARRAYYSHLPSGCYWASPYYSCGGIYYQPVVEGGVTVYVVVN